MGIWFLLFGLLKVAAMPWSGRGYLIWQHLGMVHLGSLSYGRQEKVPLNDWNDVWVDAK